MKHATSAGNHDGKNDTRTTSADFLFFFTSADVEISF